MPLLFLEPLGQHLDLKIYLKLGHESRCCCYKKDFLAEKGSPHGLCSELGDVMSCYWVQRAGWPGWWGRYGQDLSHLSPAAPGH